MNLKIKNLLIFLFLNTSAILLSQKNINLKIEYSQYIKYLNSDSLGFKEYNSTFLKNVSLGKKYKLLANDSISKYFEIRSIDNSQTKPMFIISSNQGIIYKDFNNKQIISEIEFPQKTTIKDSLDIINWTLINETDSILNYKVKKAIIKNYNKTSVVAYYTNEIKTRHGPAQFHGLPGLILKLEILMPDNNEVHIIESKKIEISSKRLKIKIPKGNFLSSEEYYEKLNEFLKNK